MVGSLRGRHPGAGCDAGMGAKRRRDCEPGETRSMNVRRRHRTRSPPEAPSHGVPGFIGCAVPKPASLALMQAANALAIVHRSTVRTMTDGGRVQRLVAADGALDAA